MNRFVIALLTASLLAACAPEKPEIHQPSDPLAIETVINLYDNLFRISDTSIMVAHQDALSYGVTWKGDDWRSDINDVCGDFPAIFGWDLGHIGDPKNIDSVPFKHMKELAMRAYEHGGINAYSWHMNNIAVDGYAWDKDTCVAYILPGGKDHQPFLDKLDLVADFFRELRTPDGEPVPLIFRPWHEMNGGWFWWGTASCSPEEYKELYRFTVEYLRDEKGLHNILYAYSPDVFSNADEYLRFYPGDDYVDILGLDDYGYMKNRDGIPETVRMLETIDSIARARSKPWAMTETGLPGNPDEDWFTDVVLRAFKTNPATMRASWVHFWINVGPNKHWGPYPGHPTAPDFVKFKEDPVTLFLSDIQSIYLPSL